MALLIEPHYAVVFRFNWNKDILLPTVLLILLD